MPMLTRRPLLYSSPGSSSNAIDRIDWITGRRGSICRPWDQQPVAADRVMGAAWARHACASIQLVLKGHRDSTALCGRSLNLAQPRGIGRTGIRCSGICKRYPMQLGGGGLGHGGYCWMTWWSSIINPARLRPCNSSELPCVRTESLENFQNLPCVARPGMPNAAAASAANKGSFIDRTSSGSQRSLRHPIESGM